ncbi:MAG: hypothetical protein IJB33_08845, partial [Akkermansia sp.]|nr:hypothetical protein [Akkermansia sp.]
IGSFFLHRQFNSWHPRTQSPFLFSFYFVDIFPLIMRSFFRMLFGQLCLKPMLQRIPACQGRTVMVQ